MKFPAAGGVFPTKDQMADYLQEYATRFALPVASNMRVESLTREGDDFVAVCDGNTFVAGHVVVAISNYQAPRIPAFASELGSSIRQLSAFEYSNSGELPAGPVLIVGVGNSGAEIAKDVVSTHPVLLAGKTTGELPFSVASFLGRPVMVHLLNRIVFPRLLSVDTPIGRRARPRALTQHVPLIRVRSKDLDALGVQRVGRTVGARDGLPVLDDDSIVEVGSVIWCTGYTPGFRWIQMPVFDETGAPEHERGVVGSMPGLYFVGLYFLTTMSSATVHGVSRDASRIAELVADRARNGAGLGLDKPGREHATI